MKKTVFRIFFAALIVGGLIYLISRTIGWHKIYDLLSQFPKAELLLLVSISFIITILKAWRLDLLLERIHIEIPFVKSLKVFIASQALSPLPGGESARSLFLKKEMKIGLSESGGAVLAQAFLELFAASIFLLGLSLFYPVLLVISLISSLFLLAVISLFIHKKAFESILTIVASVGPFKKKKEHIRELQKGMREAIFQRAKSVPSKTFLKALAIALLADMVGGLLVYLIASYYKVPLNIFQSMIVYCASVVIQGFAGFVPGGVGFTEGGTTGALLLFRVPLPKAIAIVLIFRVTTLFFSILLGMIFIGLFYSRQLFSYTSHEK